MTPQERRDFGEEFYKIKHKADGVVQPTLQEGHELKKLFLKAKKGYGIFVVDQYGLFFKDRLVGDMLESNKKRFRKFIGG